MRKESIKLRNSHIKPGDVKIWFKGGMEKRSGPCKLCGIWRYSLHRDHILALCNGGTEDEDNIQWICANCHEDKTRFDLTGRKFSAEKKKHLSEVMKKVMSRVQVRRKIRRAATDPNWRIEHSLATKEGMNSPDARERYLAGIASRRPPKPKDPESYKRGWDTRRKIHGPNG